MAKDSEHAFLAVVETSFGLNRAEPSAGPLPIVRVDPGDRADVRDLARVLRTENLGYELRAGWGPHPDTPLGVVLSIEVVRPVVCPMEIAFTFPAHNDVVLRAMEANNLGIAAEPLKRESRGTISSGVAWLDLPTGLPKLIRSLAGNLELATKEIDGRTITGKKAKRNLRRRIAQLRVLAHKIEHPEAHPRRTSESP